MKTQLYLLPFFFFLIIISASAQPGTLDNSFGNNGNVITTVKPTGNQFIQRIALQANGKIVAVGYAANTSGKSYDFILARYNQDGTLDRTFGDTGVLIPLLGTIADRGTDVKIQPDGKILASGYSTQPNTNYDFALLRYKSNGTADSSFGKNGVVLTDFSGLNDETPYIALQPDGKIILAGSSGTGLKIRQYSLVRYNSNGTIDSSFGTNGKATKRSELGSRDILVLPSGKIIVGGSDLGSNNNFDFELLRFKSNGKPDKTFGNNGVLLTDYANQNNSINSLALQGDGKIIAAGSTTNNVITQFAILRYNQNGSLDNTFGNGGIVVDNINNTAKANAVVVQSDGKIIAAGGSAGFFVSAFNLIRHNTNGTIDSSFGSNGIVSTAFGVHGSSITAAALQPDGKIITAGTTAIANDNASFRFALARYQGGNLFAKAGINYSIVLDKSLRVNVYPNPAIDVVRISGLNYATVSIISLYGNNGKLLKTIVSANKTETSISVSDLNAGMYYLLISDKYNSTRVKLVIK